MKHTVRVAACQMTVVDNPFVNCRTILRAIRSLPRRTDIVCFPETCINTNERRVVDVSVYLKSIAAACRAKRVHAIVGAYERERGRVYNVTYLFDHRGRVLHRYKKVHLWRDEARHVTKGKGNALLKTRFGKIGIITCWDYAFPEDIQRWFKKKAHIIFCPSFLIDARGAEQFLRALPLVRAFENTCYFMLCDTYTKRTAGMSMIASPLRVLASIEGRAGTIVADLDMKKLAAWRRFTGL